MHIFKLLPLSCSIHFISTLYQRERERLDLLSLLLKSVRPFVIPAVCTLTAPSAEVMREGFTAARSAVGSWRYTPATISEWVQATRLQIFLICLLLKFTQSTEQIWPSAIVPIPYVLRTFAFCEVNFPVVIEIMGQRLAQVASVFAIRLLKLLPVSICNS